MGYLFVYGTLLSGGSNRCLLEPYLCSSCPATVKGQMYHLPEGYPMLFSGHGQVCGELVHYRDEPQLLGILDELEDYYGQGHQDNVYERVRLPVTDGAGAAYEAWVYCCPSGKEAQMQAGAIAVPSGDWRSFQQLNERL
jgi:gamma-glutamylcyclotransferase (GGCT)/AIG2-like uncharacterized protein YtfP